MTFGDVVGISHWVGVFVCWFVLYRRSGLADVRARSGINWREFLIPNLGYFLLMWAKCFVWEVTLLVWLFSGRRPSPWQAITEWEGREVRAIRRVS